MLGESPGTVLDEMPKGPKCNRQWAVSICSQITTLCYDTNMTKPDQWTVGDVARIAVNPFYAINIDQGLALPHEPMISEDDWIQANAGLIRELGPEQYLRNLLSVLKGDYPRA